MNFSIIYCSVKQMGFCSENNRLQDDEDQLQTLSNH